jgi:hypothetical protein
VALKRGGRRPPRNDDTGFSSWSRWSASLSEPQRSCRSFALAHALIMAYPIAAGIRTLPAYGATRSLNGEPHWDDSHGVRRLAVFVLACGLVFAGCSTSTTSSQHRTLAETCNVFKSHYGTKQVEMIATLGQKSGDADLTREAARLETDLKKRDVGAPTLTDLVKIAERCAQLGAISQSDLDKQLGE